MRKRIAIKIFLIFTYMLLAQAGCSYLNRKFSLKDDNFIEELIEQQIENKTGLTVDLSNESPE